MAITMLNLKCPQCTVDFLISLGQYNKRRAIGCKNTYCSSKCAGLARRHNKTAEQLKEEKRIYDKKYRKENAGMLKVKKSKQFQKDYAENPEKYRAIRRRKYKKHLEYIRTPAYRKYKHDYDQKYHAKKAYGEFWQAFLIIKKIDSHIDNREVKYAQGATNKTQKRKRKTFSIQLNK